MKKILLLLFTCVSATMFSQAPFTTLSVEPNQLKAIDVYYKSFKAVTIDSTDAIPAKESKSVDFFKNNSLALSIINGSENRLSVNSQVIFYKVKIFTQIDSTLANHKYNIPLMLIAKLSTTYDSISAASAIDVLDYEAAPVTLRIMPSFKLSPNTVYKDRFLFGFYADARGINIYNEETKDYTMHLIGGGGLGFTFQGDGEAGIFNEEGEYEDGKWSLSAILQGATGKKEVIQSLFDTDKDFVTSFQSYFSFTVSEKSKFNLKIGYQHFFQKTMGGTSNNFSVAIAL